MAERSQVCVLTTVPLTRPEPAEDPSRPASAGRPAYDDDRAAFGQGSREEEVRDAASEDKIREALRLPPKKKAETKRNEFVTGGKSGYGELVDAVLPSEAIFVVGTLLIVALVVTILTVGPPPSMLDY